MRTNESTELLPSAPAAASAASPTTPPPPARGRPAVLGMRIGALGGAIACALAILLGIAMLSTSGFAFASVTTNGALANSFSDATGGTQRNELFAFRWSVIVVSFVTSVLALGLAVAAAAAGLALFGISWGI